MINKSSESPPLGQDDQEMLDFLPGEAPEGMAREEIEFYNNLQRVTSNDESRGGQGAVGAVIDRYAHQMEGSDLEEMYNEYYDEDEQNFDDMEPDEMM
jgi:hypothetical protein